MWTVKDWAGLFAGRIFFILVALYVLSRLDGRPETVIVPILGLVYSAMHAYTINQAKVIGHLWDGLTTIAITLEKEIKNIMDNKYKPDPEVVKALFKYRPQLRLKYNYLAVIQIMFLWYLLKGIGQRGFS